MNWRSLPNRRSADEIPDHDHLSLAVTISGRSAPRILPESLIPWCRIRVVDDRRMHILIGHRTQTPPVGFGSVFEVVPLDGCQAAQARDAAVRGTGGCSIVVPHRIDIVD